MRRQIAIAGSEIRQPLSQQLEMHCLVRGDSHPIVEEIAGQRFPTKSRHKVPGEIDGVELDMRESVEEGDAPRG